MLKQLLSPAQWLGGKFSGAGVEKFVDDTFYLGEYEAGLATGLGISIYADGSLHEGQARPLESAACCTLKLLSTGSRIWMLAS